jgi:glucosamine--fructose-6-phosphate aminotransferase (isomerizing)
MLDDGVLRAAKAVGRVNALADKLAGEMKHWPIAMIDDQFPVLTIATRDSVNEKTRSAIEQVKARRAPTIAIGTAGDDSLAALADDVIWVPPAAEPLQPLVSAAALQLFAYHVAVANGYDPDKSRNLAKSMTVE